MKQKWEHLCEDCRNLWLSVVESPVRCQKCYTPYSGTGRLVDPPKRAKRKRAIKPQVNPELLPWGKGCFLAWFSHGAKAGSFMGAHKSSREAERAKRIIPSARNFLDNACDKAMKGKK